MNNKSANLIIILIIIAMFTGTAIEISEGSPLIGITLFILSIVLMTRIRFEDKSNYMGSKINLIAGLFIVCVDLIYNYHTSFNFGTLDIMVLFFGVSLIGTQSQNAQINRVSRFGMYVSSVFVFLYLIFYTSFGIFKIDFLHKFDHYLILLPTVNILNMVGIPLEVISTETVRLNGAEEMYLVIGGPCSGLYSMFLLIGIVIGYSRIEKMEINKTLMMLGICIVISYLANLIRVIILYLVAYRYGNNIMMTVHTHLGWIIFAGVAAITMYFAERKR